MTETVTSEMVMTPPDGGGAYGFLVRRGWLMRLLARIAAFGGRVRRKPVRIPMRGDVYVTRHDQVKEALARDGEFFIGPINGPPIRQVNGDFILGLDRGPQLNAERKLLYDALARVDLDGLIARAAADADALLDAAPEGRIDAVRGFGWHLAGLTAQRLFGISPADKPLFLNTVRAVFYHVFMNIPPDKAVEARAVLASGVMQDWLKEEIASRRKSRQLGSDFMGQLLATPGADDEAIRRTLGGMLVGSIDTISGTFARILMVLDDKPELRALAHAARHDPLALYPICLEALRFWPQNPGMRRVAACDTALAGQTIRKGDMIFLQTQAAMYDKSAFPHPLVARGDRAIEEYFHFGSGIHACAGRALNRLELPMLVGKMLERDYQIIGKARWAGPFPDSLPVVVKGKAK
jgi:cytochrome P450